MIGRDSIFGSFSALGDPIALEQRGRADARRRLDARPRPSSRRGRTERDVPIVAGPAWAGGLCADPADRRLQRRAYRGVPAGAMPVADLTISPAATSSF